MRRFGAIWPGVDPVVKWFRLVLAVSTLLGLFSCLPVWRNSREFPILPIAPWFPVLSAPWDLLLFSLMAVGLAGALWFYRAGVVTFLIACFLAYCQDQNRGQPWLYLYWALLLFSLAPAGPALAGWRVAVTAVYFWGGVQKLNGQFFSTIPAWFVGPAAQWPIPGQPLKLSNGRWRPRHLWRLQ